jgi:hypothetical protein
MERDRVSDVKRRRSVWSLSTSAMTLSVAGLWWFGSALWHLGHSGLPILWLGTTLWLGAFGLLIAFSLRLRRQAEGYRLPKLATLEPAQRLEVQAQKRQWQWISGGQTVGAAASGWGASCFHHPELTWSLIALVVSLHFLALGRVFRTPTFLGTGGVGACVSLLAILALNGSARFLFLGAGMGTVNWLSAIYLLWNAENLADQAARHA